MTLTSRAPAEEVDRRSTTRRAIEAGLPVGRPGSMSALVAVVTLLAIELLRVFPAVAVWHPAARNLASSTSTALFVAPFAGAAALVAVALLRSSRRMLLGLAVVTAVGRVGAQLVDSNPRLVLAASALAGALGLLMLLATMGLPLFGTGVLAGVAVDLALQVVLDTRSLIWIDSPGAVAVVAAIALWLLGLAAHRARREVFVLGRSGRSALPLALVGPTVVVLAHKLGSLGWVANTLASGWLAAAIVVLVGTAAGMAGSVLSARLPAGAWTRVAAGGGVAVAIATSASAAPGWWWAPVLVAAQFGLGVLLTMVVARGVGTGGKRALLLATSVGLGLAAAATTSFDGRGVLGVPLAPSRALFLLGTLCLLVALVVRREVVPAPHRPGRVELLSLAAVLAAPATALVLCGWLVGVRASGGGSPDELRVVTYNVALAFGADGKPNLAAVGTALAELDADVVALQEVPRGQLPAGGLDMVGWLSRELSMPYSVFQPAVPGALHGNAVLSRHPILAVEQQHFAREGTALARGAVAVLVDVPDGDPMWVVGAHLPPDGDLQRRQDRVDLLLQLWAGRPRTVIAADLNTQPGSQLAARLEANGLASAWDPALGPGLTYPADDPVARIDWILHSGDLEVVGAEVHPSTASDHRPVLAVLR